MCDSPLEYIIAWGLGQRETDFQLHHSINVKEIHLSRASKTAFLPLLYERPNIDLPSEG